MVVQLDRTKYATMWEVEIDLSVYYQRTINLFIQTQPQSTWQAKKPTKRNPAQSDHQLENNQLKYNAKISLAMRRDVACRVQFDLDLTAKP